MYLCHVYVCARVKPHLITLEELSQLVRHADGLARLDGLHTLERLGTRVQGAGFRLWKSRMGCRRHTLPLSSMPCLSLCVSLCVSLPPPPSLPLSVSHLIDLSKRSVVLSIGAGVGRHHVAELRPALQHARQMACCALERVEYHLISDSMSRK